MSTPHALVVGSSGGLGAAFVRRLEARGHRVTALSRREHGLDVTDPASVAAALAPLAEDPVDLAMVATGALTVDGTAPERTLRRLDADVMARSHAINALGPTLVLKHLLPALPKDRRTVFAVLSARIGSIEDNGLGGWWSYRASKAALNQLMRCAAVELRRTHPQAVVASLHPGTVETDLTRPYARERYTHTADESAAALLDVLDGLTPKDSGRLWDYAGEAIPF